MNSLKRIFSVLSVLAPLYAMVRRNLWYFAAFAALATSARADFLYSFAYTANPDSSSPMQSFSFSFTTPSILTGVPESSPPFSPFTLTDGTTSWTMTQDLVGHFNPYGYDSGGIGFGTADTELANGGTSIAGGVGLVLVFYPGLPATEGLFIPHFFMGLFGSSTIGARGPFGDEFSTGDLTLTISETPIPEPSIPEPSSIALLATVAGLVGLRLRRGTRDRRQ